MSLKYSLVLRKDMRKEAQPGSKLYYAITKASNRMDLNKLSDAIAGSCTATRGDVKLVLEGFIKELSSRLLEGTIISLDGLGSFQLKGSSSGAPTADEFTTSQFKRARILFRPGSMLRRLPDDVSYEKEVAKVVTVVEECTKEHVI